MSGRHRVLITDFVGEPLAPERAVLDGVAEVTALQASGEADLAGQVEAADALMVYHEIAIGAGTIARLGRCRVISRCGVGYDNVDLTAARARGIPVCNVPDYGTGDVADAAIGLAVGLARGAFFLNSRLRSGRGTWTYRQAAPLRRLQGAVFAIVGLGRIGTAAALRARALGMDVVFHDPYKPDGYDKAVGVRRAETLEELLAQAFVLSLHCPLTEETHHLIRAETLEQMPMGSYLVNTARGQVVDTAAIPAAIAGGRLAGVGLDVLEVEPAREEDPLLVAWRDPDHPAHHRLVITPHTAFYSEQSFDDLRRKGAETCRRALLGQPLRNVVNA